MEQLGRVVELDSDMADVTQEPPQEPAVEDSMAEEPEAVPASAHIASTLGINPHVLQVRSCAFLSDRDALAVPVGDARCASPVCVLLCVWRIFRGPESLMQKHQSIFKTISQISEF